MYLCLSVSLSHSLYIYLSSTLSVSLVCGSARVEWGHLLDVDVLDRIGRLDEFLVEVLKGTPADNDNMHILNLLQSG